MKTVKTILGAMILATGVMSAETNIHPTCDTCPSVEALTQVLNELNPVTLEDLQNKKISLGATTYVITTEELEKPSLSNFFGRHFRWDPGSVPYFARSYIYPYLFEKHAYEDKKFVSSEFIRESSTVNFLNKTKTCDYKFTQFAGNPAELLAGAYPMYIPTYYPAFYAPLKISLTTTE